MFYQDEDSFLATPAQASKEYALIVGAENPEDAWILTHFDCWEPNPFYVGPKVPHPESYEGEE